MMTTASPEEIWNVWTSVDKWSQWDSEIESASINGVFQEGQSGKLKPKGAPEAEFYLSDVRENTSFTTHVLLPLNTKLENWHIIVKKERGESEITHGVRMTGTLSWLFSALLGGKYRKELPLAMDAVRAAAGDTSERREVKFREEKKEENKKKGETSVGEGSQDTSEPDTRSEHGTNNS